MARVINGNFKVRLISSSSIINNKISIKLNDDKKKLHASDVFYIDEIRSAVEEYMQKVFVSMVSLKSDLKIVFQTISAKKT